MEYVAGSVSAWTTDGVRGACPRRVFFQGTKGSISSKNYVESLAHNIEVSMKQIERPKKKFLFLFVIWELETINIKSSMSKNLRLSTSNLACQNVGGLCRRGARGVARQGLLLSCFCRVFISHSIFLWFNVSLASHDDIKFVPYIIYYI